MMMMRKGAFGSILLTGMVALAATTAQAAESTGAEGTDPEVTEVRVVNNYGTGVKIVAQDADGHIHILGHVSTADFAFLTLDTDVVRKGAVTIKVFPDESPYSLTGQTMGIKSVDLEVGDRSAIDVFVGSELTASSIQVTRSDQE